MCQSYFLNVLYLLSHPNWNIFSLCNWCAFWQTLYNCSQSNVSRENELPKSILFVWKQQGRWTTLIEWSVYIPTMSLSDSMNKIERNWLWIWEDGLNVICRGYCHLGWQYEENWEKMALDLRGWFTWDLSRLLSLGMRSVKKQWFQDQYILINPKNVGKIDVHLTVHITISRCIINDLYI